MAKQAKTKPLSDLGAFWKRLHGVRLRPEVAALISGSGDRDRLERMAALPDAENTFLWCVTEAQHSNHLSLWTAFVNLVPVRMLDNGDIVFVHVYKNRAAAPLVVWDHERDMPARIVGLDVAALRRMDADAPEVAARSDESDSALRFTRRAAYLVEIFSRGMFDIDRYLAFDHPPIVIDAVFLKNVETFPPTALYAMWHLYFSKKDAALAQVLARAAKSKARLISDSARLVQQVRSGKVAVGSIADLSAIRKKAAPIMNDPATRRQAYEHELRQRVDRHLAEQDGPITLARHAGALPAGKSNAPAGPGTYIDVGAGQSFGVVQTKQPAVTDLVAYVRSPAGTRRASASECIFDSGMPPSTRLEPQMYKWGADQVVLWRTANPRSRMFPFDGQISVFRIARGKIQEVASFSLDVARVDSRGGDILVTATDGTRYALREQKKTPRRPRAS